MFRSSFVAGGYAQYLKDYLEEESVIRDRLDLPNQVQHAFSCDIFEPSKKIPNSYAFLVVDGGNGPLLWCQKSCYYFVSVPVQVSAEKYVFLHYMKCTTALYGLEEELGCVSLK